MRAPTCLKMEIWDNQTGELLCRETPYHGHGRDLVRDGNSTSSPLLITAYKNLNEGHLEYVPTRV